jgi:hypothetical protein
MWALEPRRRGILLRLNMMPGRPRSCTARAGCFSSAAAFARETTVGGDLPLRVARRSGQTWCTLTRIQRWRSSCQPPCRGHVETSSPSWSSRRWRLRAQLTSFPTRVSAVPATPFCRPTADHGSRCAAGGLPVPPQARHLVHEGGRRILGVVPLEVSRVEGDLVSDLIADVAPPLGRKEARAPSEPGEVQDHITKCATEQHRIVLADSVPLPISLHHRDSTQANSHNRTYSVSGQQHDVSAHPRSGPRSNSDDAQHHQCVSVHPRSTSFTSGISDVDDLHWAIVQPPRVPRHSVSKTTHTPSHWHISSSTIISICLCGRMARRSQYRCA